MIRRPLLAVLAVLPLLAACGMMGSKEPERPMATMPAHKIVQTSLGPVIASNRGMTLYTFANDSMPGISICNDACARNWPPLIALEDAMPTGKWTVVQRSDGLKQWAYSGKPLYGWHEDKKAGDTLGDGRANGAWSVARP